MTSRTTFLALGLCLGALSGCGSSDDSLVPTGQCGTVQVGGLCTADADCAGCDAPCAPVSCVFRAGQGSTCQPKCAAKGPADTCCSEPLCADKEICAGRPYSFTVTGLSQASPPCPFTDLQIAVILALFSETHYLVKLPLAEAEFTTVEIVLPIPIIGPLTVTARREGGELVFDPETLEDIDLGELGVQGFNCLVGGTADGRTEGFGNDSLQVIVRITGMSVSPGTGVGPCTLTEPGQDCVLQAVSDGTLLAAP